MELQHIELENLKPAPLNVRKKRAKETSDLVPSIRSLGLVQPLLVRKNCEGFEIVAGQRRYHALEQLAEEGVKEPVPCLVMSEGDDAKAVEASLAENIARLPMDEIDQYKAFAQLIKQGLTSDDIASQFGVTKKLVTQRLAIANLISPILTAYSKGEIEPETLRILTMATKKQQKAWLDLHRCDEDYAPEGYQLKSWLFGGANIPVSNALFDVSAYEGGIITDLFGEDSYFDDASKFWSLQNQAIAKAKDDYLADGWSEVIVLDIGEYFPAYDYVDTAKEDGGKVYISASHDGEVTIFEGQLSHQAVKAKTKKGKAGEGDTDKQPAKPEITQAMQNYLDLHRHSAVRRELLSHFGVAIRLAVAQIIAGSSLWSVQADPQKANTDKIANSLQDNKAEELFAEERRRIFSLLGIDDKDQNSLVPTKGDWEQPHDLHALFVALLSLSDEEVTRILTFVVAETLPCGSAMVEALGHMLCVDIASHWQSDDAFFDLMRDKQAINAMLKEVAGKATADAHIASTAKVQKQVIGQTLKGERKGGKKDWQPRYMAFPMKSYTKNGGIMAMSNWRAIKKHYK
ncbi:MAG: ParB/RepB/Spo0J family partition protein [Pseudomonadota bacterium]